MSNSILPFIYMHKYNNDNIKYRYIRYLNINFKSLLTIVNIKFIKIVNISIDIYMCVYVCIYIILLHININLYKTI